MSRAMLTQRVPKPCGWPRNHVSAEASRRVGSGQVARRMTFVRSARSLSRDGASHFDNNGSLA